MRIIRSDGTMTYPAYPMPTGNIIASFSLDVTVTADIALVAETLIQSPETGMYLVTCWLESFNPVGPPAGGAFSVTHKFASGQGANRLLYSGPITVPMNADDVQYFSLPAWCIAGTPLTLEYLVSAFASAGDSCDVLLRTTVSRLL